MTAGVLVMLIKNIYKDKKNPQSADNPLPLESAKSKSAMLRFHKESEFQNPLFFYGVGLPSRIMFHKEYD